MVFTTKRSVSELDLDPWIGQRSGTFRFEVTNRVSGLHKGDVRPSRSSTPTITHDTSRTIKRQLSPLVLNGDQIDVVNPLTDRVSVFMEINGIEYPLGRYVFTDATTIVSTNGGTMTATLLDEMFIVDQDIETGFSAINTFAVSSIAENCGQMIARLVKGLPITTEIEPTPFTSIGSWSIGTARGQIIDALSLDGDYFPAWFDNEGVMRVIRIFDPAKQPATFDYDTNRIVVRDSITRTSDLLNAPNRYIVISNASISSAAPVFGSYDVPAAAPHSIANRGFVIPVTYTMPVNVSPQANAIARNLAIRQQIVERVEFTTPPDPRHDSYDIIHWAGVNWLELSWSLPLREGAEMRHVLRRTYVG